MIVSIFATILFIGLVLLILAMYYDDRFLFVGAGTLFLLLAYVSFMSGIEYQTGTDMNTTVTKIIPCNCTLDRATETFLMKEVTETTTGTENLIYETYKSNILAIILVLFGVYAIFTGVTLENK